MDRERWQRGCVSTAILTIVITTEEERKRERGRCAPDDSASCREVRHHLLVVVDDIDSPGVVSEVPAKVARVIAPPQALDLPSATVPSAQPPPREVAYTSRCPFLPSHRLHEIIAMISTISTLDLDCSSDVPFEESFRVSIIT